MTLSKFKISLNDSLKGLTTTEKPFIELLKHGSMSVEIYRPDKIDHQLPHERDEIYIIISGTGDFWLDQEKTSFTAGDLFFVPAHKEHRFENFTDNFATWVIFYGPDDEEKTA